MSDEDAGERPADREDAGEYCRQVEAYLCRKNEGHLIRIAGPSFARVCGWADRAIPLNVVYRGIDRYFERYYARGPRRRPVHIDFCEDDVLAVFDQWRRAVGLQAGGGPSTRPQTGVGSLRAGRREAQNQAEGLEEGDDARAPATTRRRGSLPAHLDRVIVRLTTLRAGGRLAPEADAAVAAAIRELDAARSSAAHLRGEARDTCIGRLRDLDLRLVSALRESIGAPAWEALERGARDELAAFKGGMTDDAYQRAVAASATRLLRERTALPTVEYDE